MRGEFALAGPSACGDRTRLPSRGDLAHVRLAGRCFVPHYAVPVTYRLHRAAPLQASARPGAEALCEVAAGQLFEVLDMAGGLAWGQLVQRGQDGLVGYLPMSAIEPA